MKQEQVLLYIFVFSILIVFLTFFCYTFYILCNIILSCFTTENKEKRRITDNYNSINSELHNNYEVSTNNIIDCTVSLDGTWQRRGYSLLNGVVAAASTQNKRL